MTVVTSTTISVIEQAAKFASGFKWISFGYFAYCITASSRLRSNSSELAKLMENLKPN